jgi:uncharacterized membrane protein YobD (UPF0266 family)
MSTGQTVITSRNRLGVQYPGRVACVRVGVGIVLLTVMGTLYRTGHHSQFEWLLAAGAVLHFVLAYYGFRRALFKGGPVR